MEYVIAKYNKSRSSLMFYVIDKRKKEFFAFETRFHWTVYMYYHIPRQLIEIYRLNRNRDISRIQKRLKQAIPYLTKEERINIRSLKSEKLHRKKSDKLNNSCRWLMEEAV